MDRNGGYLAILFIDNRNNELPLPTSRRSQLLAVINLTNAVRKFRKNSNISSLSLSHLAALLSCILSILLLFNAFIFTNVHPCNTTTGRTLVTIEDYFLASFYTGSVTKFDQWPTLKFLLFPYIFNTGRILPKYFVYSIYALNTLVPIQYSEDTSVLVLRRSWRVRMIHYIRPFQKINFINFNNFLN